MGFERLEDRFALSVTLSLSTGSLLEGAQAIATVGRDGNLASPLTVNVTSNNAAAITAPASVVIPAGEAAAIFNIAAVNEAVIDDRVTVTITVSAVGHGAAASTINIVNDDFFVLPTGTSNDVVTLAPDAPNHHFATLGPQQPAFPGVTHLVPFAGQAKFQTSGSVSVLGDSFIAVDRAKTYGLLGWAKSGDEFGERYLAGNRQSFGFVSYDADRLQILPQHVLKFTTAADTALAAPLKPGDTKITLVSAAGWSNAASNDQATRGIAWYGYADSQGTSYADYTYTRNVALGGAGGLWAPGAVSGNVITLSAPWNGPTLATGTKVRNTGSGEAGTFHALDSQPVRGDWTWTQYAATFGGSTPGRAFLPGTAYIKPLIVANEQGPGNFVNWRDVSVREYPVGVSPNLTPPPIDLTTNAPGDGRRSLSPLHPEQNVIAISVNERYTLSSWGQIGANVDVTPLGFASYDVDHKLIHPLHVTRHAYAVDTTLAAPLLPGATTLYVANASGWSNLPTDSADARSLAWYGYANSSGQTYANYTYTRNVAFDFEDGLWDAGAISYDPAAGAYRIALNKPWSGPALAAGAAIRNAASGPLHNYPGNPPQPQAENAYLQYQADIGGGVWQGGQRNDALFRPGTAFIEPLYATPNPSLEIVIGPQADSAYGTLLDPTGRPVQRTAADGTPFDLDVLAKAPFGAAATVVIDSVSATHGLVTIVNGVGPGGRAVIHYISSPSFQGSGVIKYTLRDTATGQTKEFSTRLNILGGSAQQLGTLAINVFDSSYQVAAGQTLNADGVRAPSLQMNAPNVVNAATVRLVGGTSHGTLKLNSDGTFQYTPDPGFIGSDNFHVETLTSRGLVTVTATIRVELSSDAIALARLKAIGLGMRNYESSRGRFPIAPSTTTNYFDASGNPLLSWRVHILPYIGYQSLYAQFRLNEPWNSTHNAPLAAQMPDIFRSAGDAPSSTTTRFQTISGEGSPYLYQRSNGRLVGAGIGAFTDGLQDSLLVVETGSSRAVTWTRPDVLDYASSNPLASLGNFSAAGIRAVLADGTVITLPGTIDAPTFHALVTIAGGELVDAQTLHRKYLEQTGATPLQPYGEAATEARLRSVSLAMLNYESAKGSFPVAGPRSYFDAAGHPYLSWRVHILPFLGYNTLYSKFKLDEPWNSPNNLPLLAEMPDIFRSLGDASNSTTTRIATFYGPNTPFKPIIPASTGGVRGTTAAGIRDGLQNTLMAVEAGPAAAIEWTKPGGLPFDPANPLAALGNVADGFRAVMFDGSVKQLSSEVDAATFAAMITPAGGEVGEDVGQAADRESQRIGRASVALNGVSTMNDLKQIVLAMLDHEDARNRFPSNSFSAAGQPLLSWRVHILPYMGYTALYNQFRLNEPWDSPHNLALLDNMPDIFRSQDDPWDSVTTRFTTFVGTGAPFPASGNGSALGPQQKNITDGSSNTIAVVQAGRDSAVPWTKPADTPYDANNPLTPLGDLGPSFFAAMFDGSVRKVLSSITPGALKALITHNGGENPDNPPAIVTEQRTYVRQTAGDTALNEFGAEAFDVVLQLKPTAPVTIAVASANPAIATLTHSTLTFTPDNWNIPQRVGIRAVDNQAFELDRTVGILVSGLQSFTALVRDDDVPAPLAADFTGDGVVDGSDFLRWQRSFGATGATKSQGDADGDGIVGAHDLLAWKLTVGAPQAAVAQTPLATASVVETQPAEVASASVASASVAIAAPQNAELLAASDAIGVDWSEPQPIAPAPQRMTVDLSPLYYPVREERSKPADENAPQQSAPRDSASDSVFGTLGTGNATRLLNPSDWPAAESDPAVEFIGNAAADDAAAFDADPFAEFEQAVARRLRRSGFPA